MIRNPQFILPADYSKNILNIQPIEQKEDEKTENDTGEQKENPNGASLNIADLYSGRNVVAALAKTNLIINRTINTAMPVVIKSNTTTKVNDDGSKTVTTKDAEGNIIKIVEYDVDGKVSHEHIVNDDNSTSDKYYTYENGVLEQLQETIHYPNGDYTYIFTDGNGNFKEEQKVIHHQDGGFTFDTTFGDGTRHVMVNDSNEHLKEAYFYNANGELEKTEEYAYDSINPNLYTVTTKDADGNVISSADWENYTFTDETGRTWYGCRMTARYDQNGDISEIIKYGDDYRMDKLIDSNHPEFLAELKKLAKEYENEILEIQSQITALVVPIPPNASDYRLSDGSVAEGSYKKAYDAYQKEREVYESNLNKLNLKLANLEYKLQQVNAQIDKIELTSKYSDLENLIEQLKDSPNANQELIKLLEEQLAQINPDVNSERAELYDRLRDIYKEMNGLQIPTPPSTGDFLTADGQVDEVAYKDAMNEYEYQKYQYDLKFSKLAEEAKIIENKIQHFNMKYDSQVIKMQKLENCINYVASIQDQLDNLENTPENQAEIARLKNVLSEIFENIQAQAIIQSQIDDVQNQIYSLPLPVPPSTQDYVTEDGSIDEKAYERAYNDYQYAAYEYDREITRLSELLQFLNEELNKRAY